MQQDDNQIYVVGNRGHITNRDLNPEFCGLTKIDRWLRKTGKSPSIA